MHKDLERLLDKRIILLSGEVDKRMFEYIQEATLLLRAQGSPDVEIHITSGGGDVSWGLDIYDLLRLYPGKKTISIFSIAASMGAVIVQACDVRRCAEHAQVLIHYISTNNLSLVVLDDPEKLTERMERMRYLQDKLMKILATRTGKSIDVIAEECKKDRRMKPEEALAFGLIDEII